MTNLAAKGLVVAAIIGGSLFATNGVAFAAGEPGTWVVGQGNSSNHDVALGNARKDAASKCQTGYYYQEIRNNVYMGAGGGWLAWSVVECSG
ncbi:hypothetical protein [Streptomyces sp. NPDC006668]|uniref:hypothetical protein n=1 Tax=Streptomyces sp. NPDC006668 TaxID=3156903 RepID=UPI0033FDE984